MDFQSDCILVRYGELALKGKNRRNFIDLLARNIKSALSRWPQLAYDVRFDRLFIYLHQTDPEPVLDALKNVFGISSYSLAWRCDSNIEAILTTVLSKLDFEHFRTFKVNARRNDKHFELSSDQINRMVATEILKRSDWKVDVHHPEVMITIEVRKDGTYVLTDRYAGAGGYPVGIEGKAICLLSGGIDSPAASYLIMKRGVRIEAVHFASPPYTSIQAQEKVEKLASLLSAYQGELKVHIIPFTTLQLAIYEHCPESYAITIMRRMMLRIASRLVESEHALAMASGESLGQVASQTLDSIYVINSVTNLPVLRPLIGQDKVEIIDLAKKIGTYDTSILPFEDCCTIFTPKKPVTHPKLEKCLEYESRWDYEEMINDCLRLKTTKIFTPYSDHSDEDLF